MRYLSILFLNFVRTRTELTLGLIFFSTSGTNPFWEVHPRTHEVWGFPLCGNRNYTWLCELWSLFPSVYFMIVSEASSSFLTIQTGKYTAENWRRTLYTSSHCFLYAAFSSQDSALRTPASCPYPLCLHLLNPEYSGWVSPLVVKPGTSLQKVYCGSPGAHLVTAR